jgi:hypothetical protein
MVKTLSIWIFLLLLLFPVYLSSDEIIVSNSELQIKMVAKDGEKGDKGDVGPAGPQGPPGSGTDGGVVAWVNVKSLGAKGDEKTDDTEAFKAAIVEAGRGGTIYIPRGRYIISDTLVVTQRLSIVGDGIDCQILQSSQKDLFHFQKVAEIYMRDLVLGSQARSSDELRKTKMGKAVILLENVHYSVFERVFCYGGDYGFYMKGCLGLAFNYCGQMTYPVFWKRLHYAWATWYAHGYKGYSINHISIRDPYQQCGIYGIRIEDVMGQGGITIQGGVIEGMGVGCTKDEAASIWLSGITNNWSVEGVHCEAYQSGIVIKSCRAGSIRNCHVASEQGIVFEGGSGNELHGGHISNLTVEKTETNLVVNGIKYGGWLQIRGSLISVKNGTWDGGRGYGSYGNYTWDGGQASIIENGDLESWIDGKPIGFITCGNVEQESSVVLSGTYSAKVTVLASDTLRAGLRLPIYQKKYAAGNYAFTISCYVYVPSQTGALPRLAMFFGGYGGSCVCPPFTNVERDKWTPITFTIYSDEKSPYLKAMQAVWGVWYNSQPEGFTFYLDELEVIEGMR